MSISVSLLVNIIFPQQSLVIRFSGKRTTRPSTINCNIEREKDAQKFIEVLQNTHGERVRHLDHYPRGIVYGLRPFRWASFCQNEFDVWVGRVRLDGIFADEACYLDDTLFIDPVLLVK